MGRGGSADLTIANARLTTLARSDPVTTTGLLTAGFVQYTADAAPFNTDDYLTLKAGGSYMFFVEKFADGTDGRIRFSLSVEIPTVDFPEWRSDMPPFILGELKADRTFKAIRSAGMTSNVVVTVMSIDDDHLIEIPQGA